MIIGFASMQRDICPKIMFISVSISRALQGERGGGLNRALIDGTSALLSKITNLYQWRK